MTVALLAVALAGAVGAALWFAREAREEGRLAVANAMRVFEAEARAGRAIIERDAATVRQLQAEESARHERSAHVETAQLYTAALEKLHEYTERELAGAAPGDVADVVQRMLKERRAEQAATAAAGGGVSRSATAAGVLDRG